MILPDLKPSLAQAFTIVVLLSSQVSTATAAPKHKSVSCTRETLLATAEKYVAAQTSGDVTNLLLQPSANFTYQENNQIIPIQQGIISKPLKVEYARHTADTVSCASYTELIALTPTPYVIGTQIRHDLLVSATTPETTTIIMIDSIAATTGDLFFNASTTLSHFRTENWGPILPESARPNRKILQDAIDGYLDLWGGPGGPNARARLPFGSPCERTEGSRYINCTDGIPAGGFGSGGPNAKENSMRRYVIDEVTGSANVLCSFTAVGNIPDSHEVRIGVDGRIRYVHTITLCAIDDGPDWGPTCLASRAERRGGKSRK